MSLLQYTKKLTSTDPKTHRISLIRFFYCTVRYFGKKQFIFIENSYFSDSFLIYLRSIFNLINAQ